ncbi:MAG: ABC transporter permease [Balneolaceae bacterium]|nr:ABC transporter permease [Balneolaceae bacterium]MBO6544775.1 ABC transporter permease [Balneolaceae bacterium]MBO6646171.1 ABC transporter permease [Balneolaceae bacterium]
MFKNYLKIAFRNLKKHKVYSSINVIGLAAGLACFILVGLYISYETSFDKYHENKDELYRLVTTGGRDDNYGGIAKVTAPWGEAALTEISEIESMTRFVFHGTSLMRYKENRFFEGNGFFADSSALEMFTFPLIEGDPKTALDLPNSIIIDEDFAQRFFGEENPMGKTIIVSEETEYTVTGILEEVPSNSHFTFDFLVSLTSYTHPDIDDWRIWNQFYTYVQLKDGAQVASVENQMQDILELNLGEHFNPESKATLQPITSIHLTSNLWREMTLNSDTSSLYAYGIVGFFILLLACINFINLMTARASTRLKEVGIRKTIGAQRGALIRQFLGESLIVTFIALILALIITDLFLPSFSELSSSPFDNTFLLNPIILGSILVLTLLIGFLSGMYPAFVLSSPKPSSILKGVQKIQGNVLLRKGLVVFQFAASVALICSTLVMQKQFSFMQNKDLGFDKEQVINIPIRDFTINPQFETIKEEFLQIPGVNNVSFSGNLPGGGDWGLPYVADGIPEEDQPTMRMLAIDHDFVETFGMEITEGRDFSTEYSTDVQGGFLLNEEAVKQLNWTENTLAQSISFPFDQLDMNNKPVLGVVKDFHFRSMKEEIAPIMLFIPPNGWYSQISVKINTTNTEEIIAGLEEVWAKFDPVHPMTATFFDQRYGRLHQVEENAGTLLGYLTAVAILIACFGLFGLVAFSAQQRTKEIGIRKVLGSSVQGIVGLLSKEYLALVMFGFIVGIPLSYYWISGWLNQFAYQTSIGAEIFVFTFCITVLVAMLAVCYQAIKAALLNPVQSLKSE